MSPTTQFVIFIAVLLIAGAIAGTFAVRKKQTAHVVRVLSVIALPLAASGAAVFIYLYFELRPTMPHSAAAYSLNLLLLISGFWLLLLGGILCLFAWATSGIYMVIQRVWRQLWWVALAGLLQVVAIVLEVLALHDTYIGVTGVPQTAGPDTATWAAISGLVTVSALVLAGWSIGAVRQQRAARGDRIRESAA